MPPRSSVVAAALWLLLAQPPLRGWLEATMTRHMLVDIPLLAATGFVAARGLSAERRALLRRAAGGPVPFVLVAVLTMSYWMLPRALDAALLDPGAGLAKLVTLPLLVGAPLGLGWERLGPIARGFVWANLVSMLAVLGWLYLAAPVRVCNGYLVSEQLDAGTWLVRLAVGFFLGWLARLVAGPTPRDSTATRIRHAAHPGAAVLGPRGRRHARRRRARRAFAPDLRRASAHSSSMEGCRARSCPAARAARWRRSVCSPR